MLETSNLKYTKNMVLTIINELFEWCALHLIYVRGSLRVPLISINTYYSWYVTYEIYTLILRFRYLLLLYPSRRNKPDFSAIFSRSHDASDYVAILIW